jgi:hypothetical protein
MCMSSATLSFSKEKKKLSISMDKKMRSQIAKYVKVNNRFFLKCA